MSKKSTNKSGLFKTQRQAVQKKTDSKKPVEKKRMSAMINWLLVFLTLFPFVFSRVTMDPVLSLRYTLLAAFLFLFCLYFFVIRKKMVDTKWPLLINLVFLFGIAYGLWNLISLTGAINKQQVYYGLARHFLDMLLLFVFVNMSIQEEDFLLKICKLLSLVAVAHTIIGLSQFFDGSFISIPGNFKPWGVMANRNLYGSAQVMLLPFVIYSLYKSRSFWRGVAGLSLVGIGISAILSQTRSSWMAALTMLIISLFLILIFSPLNRKKWVIGTVSGLVITILFGFLIAKADPDGEFSQSIKDRTSHMFAQDTTGNNSSAAGNVSERLKIWKKTIDVIKDNPVLGVGPGNWKIVVPKYGSEGLAWAKGKYIPDSTHNDYLLVTAESGVPGALLYFGMWVLVGLAGFKTILQTKNEDRKIFSILLFAALLGYAVDSMFSFPMERMEHTVYLYLVGGILLAFYFNSFQVEKNRKPLSKIIAIVFLVISGFNFFLGCKKFNFEKYLLRSKSLEEDGNYQQSIIEGNKARNAWVNIPPNGFPVEAYIGLSQSSLKNTGEALKEMDQALKYSPYNKALYINKGTVYTDLKQYDTAIMYYKKALALTPEMDVIYFNLAANYFLKKDYKSCLENLSKTDITNQPSLISMKQQAEALIKNSQ